MNTRLLILVLILIIVAIVLAIIRSGPSQRQEETTPPKETTQHIPTQISGLYIVKSIAPGKIFSVIEKLTITFSKPVEESTIFIDFEPEATISATLDDTKTILTIEPIQTWAYDTTHTVTISKEASGLDGTSFGKDYQFKFKTEQYHGI